MFVSLCASVLYFVVWRVQNSELIICGQSRGTLTAVLSILLIEVTSLTPAYSVCILQALNHPGILAGRSACLF